MRCYCAAGWGAFVFDGRGRFGLLGLGAPIALETQPPSPGAFVAPEVGAGVAASPGADMSIAYLASAFLGPGDDVVFAWPAFVTYSLTAQKQQANAIRVPLVA